ncbi:ankyrin repeat-containing domain protein, partial [Rhexocercosporidium sp. MPI-PUGE-AT-0058]
GRSALHCACKNGHFEVVKLLVDHGASIEGADNHGITAVLEAAAAMSLNVVKFMEEKGSDINVVAADGRTILHVSAAGNSHKILDLLAKAGANLNTRDCEGMTPLMTGTRGRHRLKAVKSLISMAENGLDLQATDRHGNTALHHAVDTDNFGAAKILIKAGLYPLKTNFLGHSAIQIALKRSSTRFALENLPEIDNNVGSKVQVSILNIAAYMGDEEVVTELLKRAPEKEVQEYVNLLCDMGTPLYCAVYRGNMPIIEKLLKNGADFNLVGGPVGSPVVVACAMGHVEAVVLFLRKGAELQCTKFDETIMTAEEAAQYHEAVLWVL